MSAYRLVYHSHFVHEWICFLHFVLPSHPLNACLPLSIPLAFCARVDLFFVCCARDVIHSMFVYMSRHIIVYRLVYQSHFVHG